MGERRSHLSIQTFMQSLRALRYRFMTRTLCAAEPMADMVPAASGERKKEERDRLESDTP